MDKSSVAFIVRAQQAKHSYKIAPRVPNDLAVINPNRWDASVRHHAPKE
jgi:hypothetical protein